MVSLDSVYTLGAKQRELVVFRVLIVVSHPLFICISSVHTMLIKIRKAKKQMQQEIGREPSAPELAHYMEMSIDKFQQYTNAAFNVVSLENPLRSSHSGKLDAQDTRTLADTIASDAPTPLEDAQRESLRRDLHQVLLDHLTETERGVLVARYGLHDGNPKTLEETARIVGVSRERVRVVETKALNKLRSPQKNYSLQTYVGGGGTGTGVRPKSKLTATTATTSSSSSIHPHKRKVHPTSHRSVPNARTAFEDVFNDAGASPFDFGISKTASKRSKVKLAQALSSGNKLIESALEHVYGGGEQNFARVSSDEVSSFPAPDRLWFF
jgi:RNA polymerase sigma factor (sigma-70 family)